MAATGMGFSRPLPLALALVLALTAGAAAGEPEIRALDVRGLQIGATTTLTIDGDELGTAPRLLLPFPAKQTLKPGATPKRAVFEVTLDGTVQPGYHNLRVVAEGGVSLPMVIGVDRLPQRPFAATVDALPIALHGNLNGSTVVSTRFTGKAGQKVIVEVEAQRMGSRLRPVVHLYDPKRKQLAWAWTKPALSGDARLEATLVVDGSHTVSLHDAEYQAGAPGFYRLKIGQWSFVDRVFPPVIGTDAKTVELLGPAAPVRVDLPAARSGRILPLTWPREGTWSGLRPFVRVSSHREILSSKPGKEETLPAGRVGVSGRLREPFAEDRYRIPVKPGEKVRLEVFAERIASPLDVALVVRNETGAEVARAEGATILDPVLDYTVPAKVTSILVGVVDAQGRGGPQGAYRLTVTPAQEAATKDFRLFTPGRRVILPLAGRSVIPVWVDRRGHEGTIDVTAAGLPAGVKLEGATIPAGGDGALVTVSRGTWTGDAVLTTWRGRGADGLERAVQLQNDSMEQLQPWLAREVAVAPSTAKATDFQIDWRKLPADAGIIPTRKLTLPVKLTRPTSASVVRLSLMTSQLPPLVNGQPNPNLALRPERPIELAAKVVDGDLVMLVPPALPSTSYDVAVQADLLGPDRRTVLATAFTPVRRMAVRMPLIVSLEGVPRIAVKLNPKTGATVAIKGKVERREGLMGDVAITLTGLPPGARVSPFTVKAGATDFKLDLILPPNIPVGEVAGLKLSGNAVADPKQPGVRVNSRDVQLTLVIQS
jgi:hypothetical protein